MGRKPKDGRGRLGGRKKGTPNKTTTTIKEWMQQLVDDSKAILLDDLLSLDPKERWQIIIKLLPYLVRKEEAQSSDGAMPLHFDGLRIGFDNDDD